jgi:F420-non-reducing hydrogenase iron-sulfur subunit
MPEKPERFQPKIVGFFCNWCTYPGMDLAAKKKMEIPAAIAPIRVMCSGRVAPVLILNAFLRGADGVIVTGCHPGECHYESGNFYGRRRFALTKSVLDALGLESDRLKLAWYSADESQKLTGVVNDFSDKIQEIGPNPIKEKSTL